MPYFADISSQLSPPMSMSMNTSEVFIPDPLQRETQLKTQSPQKKTQKLDNRNSAENTKSNALNQTTVTKRTALYQSPFCPSLAITRCIKNRRVSIHEDWGMHETSHFCGITNKNHWSRLILMSQLLMGLIDAVTTWMITISIYLAWLTPPIDNVDCGSTFDDCFSLILDLDQAFQTLPYWSTFDHTGSTEKMTDLIEGAFTIISADDRLGRGRFMSPDLIRQTISFSSSTSPTDDDNGLHNITIAAV